MQEIYTGKLVIILILFNEQIQDIILSLIYLQFEYTCIYLRNESPYPELLYYTPP